MLARKSAEQNEEKERKLRKLTMLPHHQKPTTLRTIILTKDDALKSLPAVQAGEIIERIMAPYETCVR